MKEKGLIIILSGPSGAGKGTVLKEFMKTGDYSLSISATTRKPREGEIDGVNYFFKTKEQFEEMIKNKELAEYAVFNGNYYGTPLAFDTDVLSSGKSIIFEIEVQGALQMKEKYPDAVLIFLIPPTIGELEKRLVNRGTDRVDVINGRIETAKREIMYLDKYDYAVVNDEINKAVDELRNIVNAEKRSAKRCLELINEFLEGDNQNA